MLENHFLTAKKAYQISKNPSMSLKFLLRIFFSFVQNLKKFQVFMNIYFYIRTNMSRARYHTVEWKYK